MGRAYMKGEEFKKRQLWLFMNDAVHDAYVAVADAIEDAREWFKAWSAKPVRKVQNSSKWLWVELKRIQGEFEWLTVL